MQEMLAERQRAWRQWFDHNATRMRLYYAQRPGFRQHHGWYDRALFCSQMQVGLFELCSLLITWQQQIRRRTTAGEKMQASEQVLRTTVQEFRMAQPSIRDPEKAVALLLGTQDKIFQVLEALAQETTALAAAQALGFETEAAGLEQSLR